MRLLLLATLAACSPPPAGEFETIELRADAVDQIYTLTVFEPDTRTDDGPVVYLFDGDDWSHTVAGLVSALAEEGLPAPLVVGIGYGERANQRGRDLTPPGPGLPDGWGQSDAFFAFLEDELVPVVDEGWPNAARPESRILLGHSFGGAAATYGLFTASDTFGNAVILSPSLTLGEGALFDLEADHAAHQSDLDARVYLGAGALEAFGLAGLTEAMGQTLAGRDYPSLALETELVPGRVHTDVFRRAAEHGLRFVLEGS